MCLLFACSSLLDADLVLLGCYFFFFFFPALLGAHVMLVLTIMWYRFCCGVDFARWSALKTISLQTLVVETRSKDRDKGGREECWPSKNRTIVLSACETIKTMCMIKER